MKTTKIYIKEASEILGKSIDTLRRWDRIGILVAKREKKNQYRYYTPAQLGMDKKKQKALMK